MTAEASATQREPAVDDDRSNLIHKVLTAVAVIAVFVVLGLRIVSAADMNGPIINADEAGYLVNARAIGAGEPASSSTYYPGYSALISPGFVVDADPIENYRGVMAINVVLAGIGIAAASVLAYRLRPEIGRPTAVLVGATLSALPSWLTYSPLAMSENALIPGMFVVAAIAAKPFGQRRVASLAALGLGAGLLWSVHPRAVALPLAYGAVGLVVLWGRPRSLLALFGGLGSGLVATVLFRGEVASWQEAVQSSGPDNYSAGGLLTRLTDEGSVGSVLGTAAGQTAYLLAAGSIFLVAGLLGAFPAARRLWRGDGDGGDQVQAAAAVTLLLTVGLSIFFWSGRPMRSDGAIYGRYNEPAALVLIAIGIVTLIAAPRGRATQQRVIMLGAGVAVAATALIAAARFLVPESIRSGIAVSVNIPAVLSYMPTAAVSYRRMLIATLLIAGVATALTLLRPRLTVLAMLVVSALVSGTILLPDASGASNHRAEQRIVADAVLANFGNGACVSYDRATFAGWHLFNYEYFLDGAEVERFRSNVAEPACGGLIISGRRDLAVDYPGARLLMLENHIAQDLWVLPGDQADVRDLLFPGDPAAPLPPSALEAGLELIDPPSSATVPETVRVEITHDGIGSPWPNRVGLRTVDGFVQLGARWFDESGELAAVGVADLDRTLLPGESTTVEWDDFAEVDVAPGSYRVEIDVVQQGVIWFADAGSESIVLEVDVSS